MKQRRILWYLWSYTLGGGAEKILATIVNHLPAERYRSSILEIDQFNQPPVPVREDVRLLPPLQVKGRNKLKEALLWRLRRWTPQLIRRWLVRDAYDIEVSFTVMNPPLPFSQQPNVLKIAWIHGSVEGYLEQPTYRQDYAKFLATADKIVAISYKTQASIEVVFPAEAHKICLIHNGYDFNEIKERALVPCEHQLMPDSIVVIGRVEPMKGSDRVVQVMQQLHQAGHRYHLYFIGTGELEATLIQQVAEMGLVDYIHFLGYQQNPYPLLKQARLLLTLSLQEGFPGVLVEALSLGVPFVATDVGGADELSADGQFGQIVMSDQEALAAIVHYMSNADAVDKVAMGQFIEQFTIAHQISKIETLFNEQE